MSEWIVSIVVPLLAGASYLAYRHPDAYGKIYWIYFAIYMAIAVSSAAWNFSAYFQIEVLKPFIPTAAFQKAEAASDGILVPPVPMLVAFAIWTYLALLAFLPNLIGKQKPEDKK
jgi:hypothetical protein